MKNTRYKAAVALGLATAGFVTSYPYSSGLYGGMLNSGCWAAMVGGLADWFAVTALFRKPLGFPYRTAIIPRNRERIFNDLITFIDQDLLTKSNILNTMSHYNVAELLIRFLEEHQGKQGVKEIAHKITEDVLGRLDANDFGRVIEELVKEQAGRVHIFPVLAQALEGIIKNGHDDRIIDFLLEEVLRIVKQDETRAVLGKLLTEMIEACRQDPQRSKKISWLLAISPEHLVDIALDKFGAYLQELKDPSHPLRNRLKAWIADISTRLLTNKEFQEKVEGWKNEVIRTKLNIRFQIAHYVRYLRQTAGSAGGEQEEDPRNIDKMIDEWVDGFKENSAQKAAFDVWVKNKLEDLIDKYHSHISVIVGERLAELSDELLVEFIETKVGDDLQMIRINGSVVGGLVGVLLYTLTYWLERLW